MIVHTLTLNRWSPRAACDVIDWYEMHRTLENHRPDHDVRLLFRVEPIAIESPIATVIVTNEDRPMDWSGLEDGYLSSPVEQVDIPTVLPTGATVAWKLRINPCRSHHGHRIIRAAETDQITIDLLERNGLLVHELALEQRAVKTMMRRHCRGDKPRPLTHAIACGTAEVTDPTRLSAALLNGVGDERHLGCGLLTIRTL